MVFLLWAILLVLVGMAVPLLWPIIVLALLFLIIVAAARGIARDFKSEKTKEQIRLFKQQSKEDLAGIARWWNEFCETGMICKRRHED